VIDLAVTESECATRTGTTCYGYGYPGMCVHYFWMWVLLLH
jgi:hypothetical protein